MSIEFQVLDMTCGHCVKTITGVADRGLDLVGLVGAADGDAMRGQVHRHAGARRRRRAYDRERLAAVILLLSKTINQLS